MMTRDERLKFCSVCRNRRMDMQRGIVCRLTDEYALFEGACDDFASDEAALREAEKKRREERNAPITGWLSVFLWLGLAGGSVVSIILSLVEIAANGYGLFYVLLRLGTTLMLVATAVYAIRAFYRRAADAVAAATVYIAMVFVDGLVGTLAALYLGDLTIIGPVFRQFVWSAVWFLFLRYSRQVRELFPPAERIWNRIEKYVLGIFALAYVTMLAMIIAQRETNVLLSDGAFIRQSVEALQQELPQEVGEGVVATAVEYSDGTIRFTYRLPEVDKVALDADFLARHAEESKSQIISEWEEDPSADEFSAVCRRERMTIAYVFFDGDGDFLYEMVIAPEDYRSISDRGLSLPGPAVEP